MGYKITKGSLTIEVVTEYELAKALKAIGVRSSSRRVVTLESSNHATDLETLLEAYSKIPRDTLSHKALQLLKQQPEGVTADELVSKLNLKNAQALGGLLGGITKHVSRLGTDRSNIYTFGVVNGQHVYRLTDNMVKVMDETASQSKEVQ